MTDEPKGGRFFNDPTIEESLGLHLKNEGPGPEPGQRWYSICSAHQRTDPDCSTCQVGHWHTPSEEDQKYWDRLDKEEAERLAQANPEAFGAMLYDDEFP